MTFSERVRTIYAKELIDILRDRRTLIAMVLVPIVLYPLLMLGSIQAVSYQTRSMATEKFVVATVGQTQARMLLALIQKDAAALAAQRGRVDPDSPEASHIPDPLLDSVDVKWTDSREGLEKSIRSRAIHAGVVFARDSLLRDADEQNVLEVLLDKEDMRSRFVADRLDEMFSRIAERVVDQRKSRAHLPEWFDQPFAVSSVDLSAPPSILGQVLPLILILMTITGAIYPAIDLTAGERERGTLEALMVSPVSVVDLIVGKFLVVTTVAVIGAALNLLSVTATVYFGGFRQVIASSGGALPVGKMAVILLCLIPFAVLMSAIMIAVCSYARTFKEAQNYVTPVIMAVLIPGGIAALPATRMEGVMLVMPVGNMVLLAREFLLGASVPLGHVALVLLSTTLYAGAAVAVATNVFGKESVVFADAGSFKNIFSRSLIKPAVSPPPSMSLLVVALLFPLWFFIQSVLSPAPKESAAGLLYATGALMPLLFVGLPIAVLWYWKVRLRTSLGIFMPRARHLIAAVLIGLTAWIPAHELNLLQVSWFGVPQGLDQYAQTLAETLKALPVSHVFLLIAVTPAICEELIFRGFLMSGLGTTSRRWMAIAASAAVFGVFHMILFKFAVTAALGVVLGYLCWQSRSILPGMIVHAVHNGIGVMGVLYPGWSKWLSPGGGKSPDTPWAHFPLPVLAIGGFLFVTGLILASRTPKTPPTATVPFPMQT